MSAKESIRMALTELAVTDLRTRIFQLLDFAFLRYFILDGVRIELKQHS